MRQWNSATSPFPSGLTSVLFATFPLFVALLAHFALPAERLTPDITTLAPVTTASRRSAMFRILPFLHASSYTVLARLRMDTASSMSPASLAGSKSTFVRVEKSAFTVNSSTDLSEAPNA